MEIGERRPAVSERSRYPTVARGVIDSHGSTGSQHRSQTGPYEAVFTPREDKLCSRTGVQAGNFLVEKGTLSGSYGLSYVVLRAIGLRGETYRTWYLSPQYTDEPRDGLLSVRPTLPPRQRPLVPESRVHSRLGSMAHHCPPVPLAERVLLEYGFFPIVAQLPPRKVCVGENKSKYLSYTASEIGSEEYCMCLSVTAILNCFFGGHQQDGTEAMGRLKLAWKLYTSSRQLERARRSYLLISQMLFSVEYLSMLWHHIPRK